MFLRNPTIGIDSSSETQSAAVLVNYNINPNWNLAGRVEYIGTSGGLICLEGPGSRAWSVTKHHLSIQGFFRARRASYVGAGAYDSIRNVVGRERHEDRSAPRADRNRRVVLNADHWNMGRSGFDLSIHIFSADGLLQHLLVERTDRQRSASAAVLFLELLQPLSSPTGISPVLLAPIVRTSLRLIPASDHTSVRAVPSSAWRRNECDFRQVPAGSAALRHGPSAPRNSVSFVGSGNLATSTKSSFPTLPRDDGDASIWLETQTRSRINIGIYISAPHPTEGSESTSDLYCQAMRSGRTCALGG